MKTIKEIRNDFPILNAKIRGKQLVYLDNGATAQKPAVVIDAINRYYKDYNSNIHRGVHHLSQVATTAYEEAREKLRGFINAPKLEEVIFTKGTTDSINIVASCFGRNSLNKGDEGESVRDGMDMSLISYNPKIREMTFSGANNPLYVVSNGEFKIINALLK